MTTIDPKTPVLVTGATGYVAGRLVERLLEQANQTPSVKRVVVTSSCAAIYGDNADLEKTPDGVFTEEIWNTSSSVEHQAYSYSKTLAEREAWEINQKQDRWDLVTINPTLVMGPGINPHGTSESFNMMKQYGDGTLKSGVPRWGFGIVDVRDLAEAHYRAGFTPEPKVATSCPVTTRISPTWLPRCASTSAPPIPSPLAPCRNGWCGSSDPWSTRP